MSEIIWIIRNSNKESKFYENHNSVISLIFEPPPPQQKFDWLFVFVHNIEQKIMAREIMASKWKLGHAINHSGSSQPDGCFCVSSPVIVEWPSELLLPTENKTQNTKIDQHQQLIGSEKSRIRETSNLSTERKAKGRTYKEQSFQSLLMVHLMVQRKNTKISKKKLPWKV